MPAPAPPPSGPPAGPPSEPPPTPSERPIPRGCHPLVFGIVMATIQLGLTLYFTGWCSGR